MASAIRVDRDIPIPQGPTQVDCWQADKARLGHRRRRGSMRCIRRLMVVAILFFGTLSLPAHAFCVMGMGNCVPTAEEGKQKFALDIQRKLVPPFNVESFEKINGQTMSFGGMEAYRMEFVAVISWTNDNLRCRNPMCPDLMDYGKTVDEKNKRLTLRGWLTFQKTERGWQ